MLPVSPKKNGGRVKIVTQKPRQAPMKPRRIKTIPGVVEPPESPPSPERKRSPARRQPIEPINQVERINGATNQTTTKIQSTKMGRS